MNSCNAGNMYYTYIVNYDYWLFKLCCHDYLIFYSQFTLRLKTAFLFLTIYVLFVISTFKLKNIKKRRMYLIKNTLKGRAQNKFKNKSVILFWLLNMTIWCKHVHRLELQKFLIFVLRIHPLG